MAGIDGLGLRYGVRAEAILLFHELIEPRNVGDIPGMASVLSEKREKLTQGAASPMQAAWPQSPAKRRPGAPQEQRSTNDTTRRHNERQVTPQHQASHGVDQLEDLLVANNYKHRRFSHQDAASVTDLIPDTYEAIANQVLRPGQRHVPVLNTDNTMGSNHIITAVGEHPLKIAGSAVLASSRLRTWLQKNENRDINLRLCSIYGDRRPNSKGDVGSRQYTLALNDWLQGVPAPNLPRMLLRGSAARRSLAKFRESSLQTDKSRRCKHRTKPAPPPLVHLSSHGFEITSPTQDVDNFRAAQELDLYISALKGQDTTSHKSMINESCSLDVQISVVNSSATFPVRDTFGDNAGEDQPEKTFAGLDHKALATFLLLLTIYEEQLDTLFPRKRRVTPLENRRGHPHLWSVRDWAVMERNRTGFDSVAGVIRDRPQTHDGDRGAAIRYIQKESDLLFRLRYKPLTSITDEIYGLRIEQLTTMPARRLDIAAKFELLPSIPNAYAGGTEQARRGHPSSVWFNGQNQSIDFRQHEGCLDGRHISYWVRFCAAMVGTAINSSRLVQHSQDIRADESSGDSKTLARRGLSALGHHWDAWHDGQSIYDLFDACGLDHANEVRQHFEARAAFYAVPPPDNSDDSVPHGFAKEDQLPTFPSPRFSEKPERSWASRPPTWFTRNASEDYPSNLAPGSAVSLRLDSPLHDVEASHTGLRGDSSVEQDITTPTTQTPSDQYEPEGGPHVDLLKDGEYLQSINDRPLEGQKYVPQVIVTAHESDPETENSSQATLKESVPHKVEGSPFIGTGPTAMDYNDWHTRSRQGSIQIVNAFVHDLDPADCHENRAGIAVHDQATQVIYFGDRDRNTGRRSSSITLACPTAIRKESIRKLQERLRKLSLNSVVIVRDDTPSNDSPTAGNLEPAVILLSGAIQQTELDDDNRARSPKVHLANVAHEVEWYRPCRSPAHISTPDTESTVISPTSAASPAAELEELRHLTTSIANGLAGFKLQSAPTVQRRKSSEPGAWSIDYDLNSPYSVESAHVSFSSHEDLVRHQTYSGGVTSAAVTPDSMHRARANLAELETDGPQSLRSPTTNRVIRWVLPQFVPGVPVHFAPPEVFSSIAKALTGPDSTTRPRYVASTSGESKLACERQGALHNSDAEHDDWRLVNEDNVPEPSILQNHGGLPGEGEVGEQSFSQYGLAASVPGEDKAHIPSPPDFKFTTATFEDSIFDFPFQNDESYRSRQRSLSTAIWLSSAGSSPLKTYPASPGSTNQQPSPVTKQQALDPEQQQRNINGDKRPQPAGFRMNSASLTSRFPDVFPDLATSHLAKHAEPDELPSPGPARRASQPRAQVAPMGQHWQSNARRGSRINGAVVKGRQAAQISARARLLKEKFEWRLKFNGMGNARAAQAEDSRRELDTALDKRKRGSTYGDAHVLSVDGHEIALASEEADWSEADEEESQRIMKSAKSILSLGPFDFDSMFGTESDEDAGFEFGEDLTAGFEADADFGPTGLAIPLSAFEDVAAASSPAYDMSAALDATVEDFILPSVTAQRSGSSPSPDFEEYDLDERSKYDPSDVWEKVGNDDGHEEEVAEGGVVLPGQASTFRMPSPGSSATTPSVGADFDGAAPGPGAFVGPASETGAEAGSIFDDDKETAIEAEGLSAASLARKRSREEDGSVEYVKRRRLEQAPSSGAGACSRRLAPRRMEMARAYTPEVESEPESMTEPANLETQMEIFPGIASDVRGDTGIRNEIISSIEPASAMGTPVLQLFSPVPRVGEEEFERLSPSASPELFDDTARGMRSATPTPDDTVERKQGEQDVIRRQRLQAVLNLEDSPSTSRRSQVQCVEVPSQRAALFKSKEY